MDKTPMCDFCSALVAPWVYGASDFVAWEVSYLTSMSAGDWAACDDCKVLIDAYDLHQLAERSYKMLLERTPMFKEMTDERLKMLKQDLKDLHSKFFLNRTAVAN